MKNHHVQKPQKVRFDLNLFQKLVKDDLSSALPRLRSVDLDLRPPEELLSGDPESYFAARQFEALTKKNVDAPGNDTSSRKAAALATFEDMEYHCWLVNASHDALPSFDRLSRVVIDEAKGLIQDILGDLSVSVFREICSEVRFGSGMTFSDTCKSDSSLVRKLGGKQSVTRSAIQYLPVVAKENPALWALFDLANVEVVSGNRVTTVPKTASTDRTIAIEPSFNMLLQRGVDIVMRKRLARYGVDLSDQTRGWLPAKSGSMTGRFATIDLSSASDTLTQRWVKEMIPYDWYVLLDDLRSHEYTLDRGRTWRKYSKFSSMGNSFTFPLESLLFYSVAQSATRLCAPGENAIVYGDDIVVPQEAYALVVETLLEMGFIPNPAKSFAVGNFRETCGRDYHYGVDVRPVYLSSNPKNEIEVYNLFNRLLNNRQGIVYHYSLAYLFGLVTRPKLQPRYFGPGERWLHWEPFESAVYDGGFMVPRQYALQRLGEKYHSHYQSMAIGTSIWSTHIPRFKIQDERYALALSLYTGDHVAKDVGRVRYTPRKITVTRWFDAGSWPVILS